MYSIMGTCVVYTGGSLKGGVGYIKINSYVKLIDIVWVRVMINKKQWGVFNP